MEQNPEPVQAIGGKLTLDFLPFEIVTLKIDHNR
jgi:hypothetical protein